MNTILPIGSVVRIKDVKEPIMIFGCLQETKLYPDKVVDYVGVPYPLGNINLTVQLGFQMTDIEEVLFEGYYGKEFAPIATLLAIRQEYHSKHGEQQ